MKLFPRLFRKPPPPPAPEPAPTPVAPAPPVVEPAEHARLVQLIADGALDPTELAQLAVEGPTTRVRQSAAAAIADPAQLHDLLPRLRGKDKAVYKLIKQKCDVLLAEQRKAEDDAREAAALCESIERHSARPHDALYAATLASLTTRWRALPTTMDPQVRQRGQQALERCQQVIAAHEQEVARQAAEHAAQQAAQREAREAREREQQARQQAAALQAEAAARAQAEAAAAREAAEQARAEQRAAETQAQREIGSLIRLCSAALQRGDTRKAARFRAGVEEALPATHALPPYLARALQQLDERLNELRQWKDYAVAPKRIELIEEMEALVGSQEEPAALAEHIRALQQEWRTINKGIASDASEEAERFQQAHRAAFKPCEAYFAAQAAVRRENLEARRHVLERLQAFEASLQAEHPDYPFILQVLREAPLEWRSHFPVDRDAGRATETEFHHSLDRLRGILNAWHEAQRGRESARSSRRREHLSSVEDTTQAIDGVKRLQLLWKETGPVSRDQSQALWDEFRGLCDAVYQRREQAYVQYSAGLEAAKAQAVALCEQVEQAASVPAAERLTAHARVREWHAAFEELGELPRAEARGLRDRFERAVSRFEAGLAQQDQRDAESAESNLFEAGRHVRAYERALMQNAPDAEREILRSRGREFHGGRAALAKGRPAGVEAGDGPGGLRVRCRWRVA